MIVPFIVTFEDLAERRRRMARDAARGLGIRRCALRYACSTQTVRNACHEHQVVPRAAIGWGKQWGTRRPRKPRRKR